MLPSPDLLINQWGLGKRPIINEADTHQLFADHEWQDRAYREQFIMLLRNATACVYDLRGLARAR